AEFVAVKKLDGILDGDDVLAGLGVDLVDDRGERGRLARSGRPGDEHQPARFGGEIGDDRRKPELVERAHLEWNRSKRARHRASLYEQVRSKTRKVLDAEREVELVRLLESYLLLFGQDRITKMLALD